MVSIAICDDDAGFRHTLAGALQQKLRAAYSIRQYADGVDLLRALERRERPCDLVLLDIRMPGLDGLQTARRIRELDVSTVVILVTGYGEYVFEGYDVRAFQASM